METEQPRRRTNWPAILLFGAAMLVAGLFGGFYLRDAIEAAVPLPRLAAAPQQAAAADAPAPPVSPELMKTALAGTRHFLGDPKAPVTMIEVADYQCPFCASFAAGAGRQILDQYVKKGIVRLGFVHLAFLGQESVWAAEASECADEQNAFWSYHDLLFARQKGENQGAFTKGRLKALAGELKLDAEAFGSCLDSGKYTSKVQADISAAQSWGVRSTPTFLMNGQMVQGALPWEQFRPLIERARSGSKATG